jgi:heavy metal sensor kinase
MKRLTLRGKLVLWFTTVLAVLLIVFALATYASVSNALMQSAQSLVKAHASQAVSIIDIDKSGKMSFDEPLNMVAAGTFITVYNNQNIPVGGNVADIALAQLPPEIGSIRSLKNAGNVWLVYDEGIYENNNLVGWVRACRSIESTEEALNKLKETLILAVPLCLLAAIGGGFFLASRAMAPIAKITNTARSIGQGDLSQRLNLPNTRDEVGNLARTFDEMLDKLESAFKKEQQFTSDASHELRTPLSVISLEAENALEHDGDPEMQKEALQTILDESQKMKKIVSQLLTLSRSDSGTLKPMFEQVDLVVIAKEVIAEMQEVAADKQLTFSIESPSELFVTADQTLITEMLINLLDNAIKYNKAHGWVKLRMTEQPQSASICVEDNGIGIPEKDLPHVFDRFYRGDTSRHSEGTGLGLSIVKTIVDIHKGQISVQSDSGKGSTFCVTLPKNPKV